MLFMHYNIKIITYFWHIHIIFNMLYIKFEKLKPKKTWNEIIQVALNENGQIEVDESQLSGGNALPEAKIEGTVVADEQGEDIENVTTMSDKMLEDAILSPTDSLVVSETLGSIEDSAGEMEIVKSNGTASENVVSVEFYCCSGFIYFRFWVCFVWAAAKTEYWHCLVFFFELKIFQNNCKIVHL